MIKEIVKDIELLQQQSRAYIEDDAQVITDLLDTAEAHKSECAGLAAVQIGYLVKAFVMKVITKTEIKFVPVINPVILKRSSTTYTATEGCLSLEGERTVKRHDWIDVIYYNHIGSKVSKRLTGFQAEVFQHEFDHLRGIII